MEVNCTYDELVQPHKLVANPKNPNTHSKEQIERLTKIIDFQGQRSPIIVSNQSGFIVVGHGRLEAMKQLEAESVAVNYQDFENEAQEYAHMTADNAIAEWAELNIEEINSEIENFDGLDYDMLGLKDFEVDVDDKPEPGCDEDEVPEVEHPITRKGDIWLLGDHRVMCGDSTLIGDVEKLMNGNKADMIFTDPPYNTGMKSKADSTRLSHMFNDEFTEQEWQNLLSGFTSNGFSFLKDNSAGYFCMDWRRNHELQEYLKRLFKLSNVIVWDKVVHGLGSDYKYTYELINVCKKGDPELDTHQGEKEYSDVWHIQRKMSQDQEHATKKPIEII
mgnify:CR=1 FL=1